MRDIRQDLKERLGTVFTKRHSLTKELQSLDEQAARIKALLDAEDAMWQEINPPLFEGLNDKTQSSPLSQVLLDVLRAKDGPATLDELKDAAVRRGVPFGDKQPGRVIHFAMIGMAQHNLVARHADGRWGLAEGTLN